QRRAVRFQRAVVPPRRAGEDGQGRQGARRMHAQEHDGEGRRVRRQLARRDVLRGSLSLPRGRRAVHLRGRLQLRKHAAHSDALIARGGGPLGDVFLYLTTTGRTSGLPRRIEIWFVEDGGRYFIVAEMRRNAGWVKNLEREPRATIMVGTRGAPESTL